jgi:hypothetical protein
MLFLLWHTEWFSFCNITLPLFQYPLHATSRIGLCFSNSVSLLILLLWSATCLFHPVCLTLLSDSMLWMFAEQVITHNAPSNLGPCHSSGSKLPATHRGSLDSCPGQCSGISGGQSGSGIGFSTSSSVFPCQYHSTTVSYSFMYHLGDGQWAH